MDRPQNRQVGNTSIPTVEIVTDGDQGSKTPAANSVGPLADTRWERHLVTLTYVFEVKREAVRDQPSKLYIGDTLPIPMSIHR